MTVSEHIDDNQPAAPHYSLATMTRHLLMFGCIAYGLVRLLQVIQS